MTSNREADPVEQLLFSIATDMTHVSAALLKMAQLAHVTITDEGALEVRAITPGEELPGSTSPMRFEPGQVKVHGGAGGPLAWVFVPPPPYNAVEIVCSPDEKSPVGMRCYAEQRVAGGERVKYQIDWEKK